MENQNPTIENVEQAEPEVTGTPPVQERPVEAAAQARNVPEILHLLPVAHAQAGDNEIRLVYGPFDLDPHCGLAHALLLTTLGRTAPAGDPNILRNLYLFRGPLDSGHLDFATSGRYAESQEPSVEACNRPLERQGEGVEAQRTPIRLPGCAFQSPISVTSEATARAGQENAVNVYRGELRQPFQAINARNGGLTEQFRSLHLQATLRSTPTRRIRNARRRAIAAARNRDAIRDTLNPRVAHIIRSLLRMISSLRENSAPVAEIPETYRLYYMYM